MKTNVLIKKNQIFYVAVYTLEHLIQPAMFYPIFSGSFCRQVPTNHQTQARDTVRRDLQDNTRLSTLDGI